MLGKAPILVSVFQLINLYIYLSKNVFRRNLTVLFTQTQFVRLGGME